MTAITATVMFSWASISHLNDLIEVQQLPTDMPNHSLLERAEHNIASHLHLGGNTGVRRGASLSVLMFSQQAWQLAFTLFCHLHYISAIAGSTVGGSSGGSNSAFRSSGNGVGGASHAIATEQQGGKGGGAVKADPNVIGQQAPAAKRDVGVSSPKPRSPPKLPPPESKKAAAKAAGGTCEGVTILKHTE